MGTTFAHLEALLVILRLWLPAEMVYTAEG
jgi:hypothetical protein